jgi:hypothetical protein
LSRGRGLGCGRRHGLAVTLGSACRGVWYTEWMTKKLREVLERAETWPQEAQEELARMAYEIEGELKGDYHATLEELRAIDDAQKSGVATEKEVEGALRSFRGI